MDSVSSNPLFNPARLYQQNVPQRSAPQSEVHAPSPKAPASQTGDAPASDFSLMFGESELQKLQSNLEAIAQMAESALKRFDG